MHATALARVAQELSSEVLAAPNPAAFNPKGWSRDAAEARWDLIAGSEFPTLERRASVSGWGHPTPVGRCPRDASPAGTEGA